MKKSKILFLGLLGLTTCTVVITNSISLTAYATVINPTEFTTFNKYNYRATLKFESTVDSLEAWVNIPSNSLGGAILSTWNGYSTDKVYQGFQLEVDALGRIKYSYMDNSFHYTFADSNVMDSKWHHVAIVRNDPNRTLNLYLDGELNESINVKLEDAYPKQNLFIGVNPRFWNNGKKAPLEGYIRQATLYEGAITEERVKEDMHNTVISSDDTNARLLANWDFGDRWTKRVVQDTSNNHNDCNLETFEKYVGVADNRDFDYSFIILPDVQCMNRYKHERFSNMIDWIVNNRENLKLKFLMEVGDLSDSGYNEEFYRTCAEVMNKLNNKVPWCFVPGNHDYDDNCNHTRNMTFFNTHFSYDLHSTLPGFGGVYEEGHMENSYYLFDIGEVKYLIINLEYGPRMDVLRWASRLCEKYSDRRVIAQTHAYIDPYRHYDINGGATTHPWRSKVETTSPKQFHDELLVKHSNFFMGVGGHYGSDDIVYVPGYGEKGNKLHSFLIDNQASVYDSGIGEDTLALFKVNEKTKTISVCYYSPYHDKAYNIQNQFEFNITDAKNPAVGL